MKRKSSNYPEMELYYTPQLEYNIEHGGEEQQGGNKSSYTEAICNIFKSQVGATMLAIPFSMSQCGIGYGVLIQLLTTLLMLYGVNKLVKIADEVQKPNLYYPELVEQILGKNAGIAIGFILGSLSVGACIAYLIFFKAFIKEAFLYAGGDPSELKIIVITLVILLPFIFVNNFHLLNRSSAFAMMLMFFTISYVVFYDMSYIKSNPNSIQYGETFNFWGIPQFIGVAVFASEGIPCVFHIRESLQKKKDFMKLYVGTVIGVFILYMVFTIINILTFGVSLNQIVLMNVPYTSWASFVAKIGFASAILLTYPIQIFPVYSMVEKTVLDISKNVQIEDLESIDLYKIYGIRISILASIFLCAYLLPSFAGILNFLGCISGCTAQYIFPLLMDNKYQGESKSKISLFIDYILILISVLVAIICGYISLKELIE